jgi:iduronate 2-sulfatase
VPLLRDAGAAGKGRVFSQYPHYSVDGPAGHQNPQSVMGYSMRTAEWRYTEWLKFDCDPNDPMAACAAAAAVAPQWGERVGVELYDHQNDPASDFGTHENANLANKPEHAETVAALHKELVAGWSPPEPPVQA